MNHEVSHIVCFYAISVKRKENDLHRQYTFWGGLVEKRTCSKISQILQNL